MGEMTRDMVNAMQLASEKHRWQMRDDNTSALAHLLRVAAEVAKWEDSSSKAFCISMLHDIVEDSDVDESKLTGLFDSEIAAGIMQLTKKKGMTNAQFMPTLADCPCLVVAIKVADRTDNLEDILNASSKKWPDDRIAAYLPSSRRLLAIANQKNVARGLTERLANAIMTLQDRLIPDRLRGKSEKAPDDTAQNPSSVAG